MVINDDSMMVNGDLMMVNDDDWLVVGIPTPLKNDGVSNSWDDKIDSQLNGKSI